MSPIKSSLARSAGKPFGVYNQTDLRLRGVGQTLRDGSLFPDCTNRPSTNKFMSYPIVENGNTNNFFFCNGDSHFTDNGSTIVGVTAGDPLDPISNMRPGYVAIRFGTPQTITGMNFAWRHTGNQGYCAGNSIYLLNDVVDGIGQIRSYLNTDTSNRTLSEWKTYYDNQGLNHIIYVPETTGGCTNPNVYNQPGGSYNYPNIRWFICEMGRPGDIEAYSGTAGNGAFVITPSGNINL